MQRTDLAQRRFPKSRVSRRADLGFDLERLEERSLLSTGLVAAYSFDEGSGTVLHDTSGNGNNGTISGATWSTSGKFGDALSFNGTSAVVNIPNAASLELTTGMTLEAWVDPSAVTSAWRDVVYKGNDNYFLEATSTSNKSPAAGATFGSADVFAAGTKALATNTWTFLSETYNGSTLALYVNGVEVSSLAESGNILTSTNALQIGGDSIYGQYFKGLIDNVRIYNTALTAAQIQTDMTTDVTSTAPAVASETPGSGATGVATNTGVTATFNQPVQASSVTTSAFTLKNAAGTAVAGTVAYNSTTDTATLTPTALLANSTNYTATLSGVTNAAGVAMASPFTWSFTTGPAPAVTGEAPAASATGVAVASSITATFNEAVQSGTIIFTLETASGTAVATSFTYNSTTNSATWQPTAALANSTTYTATVSGVKDAAGDSMTSPFTWSFTTAALAIPTVTSHTPASGATGVAVSSVVTATFNEAVQSGTIAFTLTSSSGSSVAATVSYTSASDTATLTPSAALAYSTTYTAKVSGAQNLAGVAMTAPVSWSFTTAAQSTSTGDPTTLAPSLGAPPSPGPNAIWVSTQAALQTAFSNLQSGQTIVIEPGTYDLSSTLYIGKNSNITNVTVRGSTDNFNDVTLLGVGMDNASYGSVPNGISIYNAQNVTIADLSIGDVYYDPIEVKGDAGASAVTIYHVHLFDAGEQFIKVDPPASGFGTSNSAVEYSEIDYTNGPPVTDHGGGIGYTNAIDILAGNDWLVAHNLIENMHTPDADTDNLYDPAILVWFGSNNVTVNGNTLINSDRAIAFGLGPPSSGSGDANDGGIIENNFIYQAPGLFSASRAAESDGQIIAWDSPDSSQILFNTILTNGNSTDSIQLRYTTTGAVIDDNLADAPIRALLGATYTASGNYLSATPSMFVNPSSGDLHLIANSATEANVIDQVVALANDPTDWNGNARVAGSLTDIGADASLSSSSESALAAAASPASSVSAAAAAISLPAAQPTIVDAALTTVTATPWTAARSASRQVSYKPRHGIVGGLMALSVTPPRNQFIQSGANLPWSRHAPWSNLF